MRPIAPLHATWPQLMQHHQRSILLHVLRDSKGKGSVVLQFCISGCSVVQTVMLAIGILEQSR